MLAESLLPAHLSILAEALRFKIVVFHDTHVELFGDTPKTATLLLSCKNNIYSLVKSFEK